MREFIASCLLLSLLSCTNNNSLFVSVKKNKTQIILATGAILGLDALRAASESIINSVKMITRKPPNALSSAPYIIENKINSENKSFKLLQNSSHPNFYLIQSFQFYLTTYLFYLGIYLEKF